jgi:ribosome biogenesis protein YTM1
MSVDLDDTNFQPQREVSRKKRKAELVTKVPLTKIPLSTLQSHRDAVMDVCWNPLNSDQAITASWDQSIMLWDVELSGMISSMSSSKAHSRLSVNSISGLILTASMDSVIRLWDFRSKGKPFGLNALECHISRGFYGEARISWPRLDCFRCCLVSK